MRETERRGFGWMPLAFSTSPWFSARGLASRLRWRQPPDSPSVVLSGREPRKLPVVLSADEVVLFLEVVSSLNARVALTTAYAAGLRASEVAAHRRHRQRAHVDADRALQGREGARRDAVAAAARHPAPLLAAGGASAVLVSGPNPRQADRTHRAQRARALASRLEIGHSMC